MQFGPTCIVGFLLLCVSAGAGSITGSVSAKGKTVPGSEGGGGKYESRKYKFLEKVDYSRLQEFVVSLEGEFQEAVSPSNTASVVVHKSGTFHPHVLPVQVGTSVRWPNQDEIYHNAFSISESNPFDLGLYKDETKELTFTSPGRVDVFCSIHKNMHCIVLVMPNPYFATTDKKGRYKIADVPAGTYKIKAWHERMPARIQDVIVPAEGEVNVDFTLKIQGLPTK
jgi:plastocyanin